MCVDLTYTCDRSFNRSKSNNVPEAVVFVATDAIPICNYFEVVVFVYSGTFAVGNFGVANISSVNSIFPSRSCVTSLTGLSPSHLTISCRFNAVPSTPFFPVSPCPPSCPLIPSPPWLITVMF